MIALYTNRHNPVTYHRLNPFAKLGLDYYWVEKNIKRGTTHLITNNTLMHPDMDAYKKWMQEAGIKLVFDIDDYWHIDRWNPAYSKMQQKLKEHIKTISLADIITTTHERLVPYIREVNKEAEIVIVPNGLDETLEQWQPQPLEEVSFGYVGGPTHKRDIEQLKGAERKIDILAPEYFKNKLQASRYYKYVNYDNYGFIYNQFTVSLAPIYPTLFSSLKSDLKAVEAGFKNRMLIASKTQPYLDNPAIQLRESYTEWNSLKNLSLDEVQDYAGRLNEWATKNRKLSQLNNLRKQILEK